MDNNAPDITEMLETIEGLMGALRMAQRYCEHPDVKAMSFVINSQQAANRAAKELEKAQELLLRV